MKYKINDKVVDVRILKPTDSIRELNIKDPFETARIASLLESRVLKPSDSCVRTSVTSSCKLTSWVSSVLSVSRMNCQLLATISV